jgi:hypothetical protein
LPGWWLAEPAPRRRGVLDHAHLGRLLVGARAEAAVVDGEHRETEVAHLLDAKRAAAEVLARAVEKEQLRRLCVGVRRVDGMQADRTTGGHRLVLDPDAFHVLCPRKPRELVGRCRRHRHRLEDPLALLRADRRPAGGEAAEEDDDRGDERQPPRIRHQRSCCFRFHDVRNNLLYGFRCCPAPVPGVLGQRTNPAAR